MPKGKFAPPSPESKIEKNIGYYQELALYLRKIRPKGWIRQWWRAKKMIKRLERKQDEMYLERLVNICKTITRHYRKKGHS